MGILLTSGRARACIDFLDLMSTTKLHMTLQAESSTSGGFFYFHSVMFLNKVGKNEEQNYC